MRKSDGDNHCPEGHKITDANKDIDVLGRLYCYCKTCDQWYRWFTVGGWMRVMLPRWDDKPITADDIPPLPNGGERG